MTVPDDTAVPPPAVDPSDQLELKLPDESGAPRDIALWAGVLVLLSLVVFWPAIGGSFQFLDDRAVQKNVLLAKPGGLSGVWTGRWDTAARYGKYFPVYEPVAFTANWLAYRLGGHDDQMMPTPTAYHVVALVCHVGAAVLAWLVLRELLVPGAWLVAAVFAMHPVNAEAVSWIADGGVAVGGLLFWGSAYSYFWYMRFRDRDAADLASGGPGGDPAQTWGVYGAAALLAILAALAWPPAGVVPGVLMLALWWRRRLTSRDGLLLTPVMFVTAILWLANLTLPRHSLDGGVVPVADVGLVRMVALVGESIGFAVMKVLVPVPLSILYRSSLIGGLATLVLAIAAVAGAAWLAVRRDVRWPIVTLGSLILGVVPALNWFDVARYSEQVDSVAYLAVVPLATVVLTALAAVIRKHRTGESQTQVIVIASGALLVLLGSTAWTRAHVFETPVSLWQDTAAKLPRSAFASASLAEQYRLRSALDASYQDVDQATADLKSAQEEAARAAGLAAANRQSMIAAGAQRTWALALVATGDAKGALPHFAISTAINADDAATLVQYGQALLSLGETPAAIARLDSALAADPRSAAAHRVLGQAYHKAGNEERCLVEEQKATTADPSDMVAQQLLAEALTRAGRLREALERYAYMFTASKECQTRADLWAAIGKIKDRQGAYDQSVAYFAQAQQLDSTLPDIDHLVADAKAKLKRAAVTRPAMTRPASAPTTAPDAQSSPFP